jgi:50S ribosomal protein L16 3-hydroxylase
VLQEWLGLLSVGAFLQHHLGRMPLARPATVADPRSLLDWEILDAVLAADPAPDVLVVAAGKLLPLPPPRSINGVRDYLRRGVGLCLRHTERCHPGLADVAAGFAADLGQAQVQLFVTPGGTYGFGWHYDDEDVFIAQTAGAKDYYFRANTVCASVAAHGSAFVHFREESSALCAATLVQGDFLYLPRRWWHMALCRSDALSVSVGVVPRPGMLASTSG